MVDFMERHGDIAYPLSSISRQDSHLLWTQLADKLNNCGGPTKPLGRWKKSWADLKFKSKKKYLNATKKSNIDTPITKLNKPITKLNKKVITLIGKGSAIDVDQTLVCEDDDVDVLSKKVALITKTRIPKASSIKCVNLCRICLSMDDQMCMMESESPLKILFEKCTGILLSSDSRLPKLLCDACSNKLKYFNVLIRRSIESQYILQKLLLEHEFITEEHINAVKLQKTQINQTANRKTESPNQSNRIEGDTETKAIKLQSIINNANIDNTGIDNTGIDNTGIDNPDIDNADIDNTNIDNADIDNTDIENTNIDNTVIDNADIDNADIDNTNIDNADIDNSDIDNADIDKSDIVNTDIDNADIDNSGIDNIEMEEEFLEDYEYVNTEYLSTNESDLSEPNYEDTVNLEIVDDNTFSSIEEKSSNETINNNLPSKYAEYECSMCGQQFSSIEELTDHINKCNSGIKSWKPQTKIKTDRKRRKRKELKKREKKKFEKTFMCDICGKLYPHLSLLNNHKHLHFKSKRFFCNYCDKGFPIKTYLIDHLLIHEEVKRFSCEICNRRFTNKKHLRRHLYVHTDRKQFKCSQCDMMFKTPSQKRSHFVIVHQKRYRQALSMLIYTHK